MLEKAYFRTKELHEIDFSGVIYIHVHVVYYSIYRFFDTTPIGRVLNRLSNDTRLIDIVITVIHYFFKIDTHYCLI